MLKHIETYILIIDTYVSGRSLRSNQSNLLTVPSCKLNFSVLQLLLFGTLFLQKSVLVHYTVRLRAI